MPLASRSFFARAAGAASFRSDQDAFAFELRDVVDVLRAAVENPHRLRQKPAHGEELRGIDVVREAALDNAGLHIRIVVLQGFEVIERTLGLADLELYAFLLNLLLEAHRQIVIRAACTCGRDRKRCRRRRLHIAKREPDGCHAYEDRRDEQGEVLK